MEFNKMELGEVRGGLSLSELTLQIIAENEGYVEHFKTDLFYDIKYLIQLDDILHDEPNKTDYKIEYLIRNTGTWMFTSAMPDMNAEEIAENNYTNYKIFDIEYNSVTDTWSIYFKKEK